MHFTNRSEDTCPDTSPSHSPPLHSSSPPPTHSSSHSPPPHLSSPHPRLTHPPLSIAAIVHTEVVGSGGSGSLLPTHTHTHTHPLPCTHTLILALAHTLTLLPVNKNIGDAFLAVWKVAEDDRGIGLKVKDTFHRNTPG